MNIDWQRWAEDFGDTGQFESSISGMGIAAEGRKALQPPASSGAYDLATERDAHFVFEAFRQGDPNARSVLERIFTMLGVGISNIVAILDPELWRRVREAVEEARRSDAAAVVLDAALILEKGLDKLCTVMVYIGAPEEVRRVRAIEARGWDSSEVIRREALQFSLKAKQDCADYIVDNSTSPELTFEQVRTILSRIVR
jgi:dephospho-CoA kinase